MATIDQLSTALVNADKAGDTQAAKILANEILRMRSAQPDQAPAPESPALKDGLAQLSAMTQNPQVDPNVAAASQRDKYYSSGIYAGSKNPLGPIAKTIDAFASGAQRSPLFGWDDEAQAALATGGGQLGDYEKARAGFDAQKAAQRQQNPGASIAGELTGGLATGGTIASTGATLAGRSLPIIGRTGGAALEGMGYGALYGAGEANPGQRTEGAITGGATGAVTGAVMSKVGDMLASRLAKSAAQEAAPSVDDLTAASRALYDQADQAGVVIKPQAADDMINNMQLAAGRPNDKLRPKTAGLVEDLAAEKGQPMTLARYHELRQEINLSLKNAEPQDERTLMRMKNILDGFSDNASPTDVTGDVQGLSLLKQANDVWAKRAKTQKIEDLFDLADVKSARYSQSGMANAVRDKASQLYTRIVKGQEKSFTPEETALIRQLAKGEMTPKLVNWLGKFAPRGIVSSGLGASIGSGVGSFLGPAGAITGAAVPGIVGYGAARAADSAAAGGVNALRNAAATGTAPVLGAITNKTVPFVGSLSGQSASQLRQLLSR